MSEVGEAPVQSDVTAGTLLRRAREASGLHVAALAVSLKVPVRKLEALEDDRYEDMGDAVFIRGLASSVCRTLKVDPQPILQRLPQTAAPRLVRDNDGLNAPFRAPSDAPPETWLDRIRQPVPATVAGLLAAAVLLYFVPIPQVQDKPAAAPVVAPAPQPVAASSFAPAVVPAVAAPVPAPVAAQTPPAAAAESAVPAAPAAGIVVIRTKGDSWVEILDAKGNIALRKLMAPGESIGTTGPLPLQVTIGRADQTEVEVRGARYDLRPVSRDNVARFEVK